MPHRKNSLGIIFAAMLLVVGMFLLTGTDSPAPAGAEEEGAQPQTKSPPAEAEAGDPKADTEDKADEPDEPVDPLQVPEGDAEQLAEFIDGLRTMRPDGNSRAEMIDNYKKILKAMSLAADRLLAASREQEEGGLESAVSSIRAKVSATGMLGRLGDEGAAADMKAFVAEMAKDEREKIVEFSRQLGMELKYQIDGDADEAAIAKLAGELKQEFGDEQIDPRLIQLVMQFVQQVERRGFLPVAADLNDFFAKKLADSEDEQLVDVSKRMAGAARRLNLPGNSMELDGTFIKGGELDWKSYRGKVVLIDYWATWCGPCRAELPNVMANYDRYHDHGFDVLGISLDDSREAVEQYLDESELPWKTLFSDNDEETGWKHPMALRYGISGIPQVILVDKQGKVVSLNARGRELGRLLEDLLGPVPEPVDADEEESDEDKGDEDKKDEEKESDG